MITRLIVAILMTFACYIGIQGEGNPREKPLKIRAIYPAGEEVATSDRITIEFNQNVVSLGASMFIDDVVPVDIEPAIDCEWNWVDLDTLQCALPDDIDLASSTKYTVTIRPGITSPHGQLLDEEYVHSFETILPEISSLNLISWISPTQPIIEVCFNQEISLRSLQDKLFLHDSNTSQKYSVRVWPHSRELRKSLIADYFGREQNYQNFTQLDQSTNVDLKPTCVLLLPREQLLPAANVSLLLLPAIQGAHGNIATTKQVIVDSDITTVDEFNLLGLICQDTQDDYVLHQADQSLEIICEASSNFALVFSSPVNESLDRFIHTDPPVPLTERREGLNSGRFGRFFDPFEDNGFKLWFRRDFKPNTTYRLYVVPSRHGYEGSKSAPAIQDGFERSLVGSNQIKFRTANSSAKTFLAQSTVVVDANGSFEPKLYTRNVEDIVINYSILDEEGEQRDLKMSKPSPTLDDILHSQELGLRTVLRSSSGAMIGTIASREKFGEQENRDWQGFFVQATPYSVFLKVRDYNILVWVVDLLTGEPISNARVEFLSGTPINFSDSLEPILSGVTDKHGLVNFRSPNAIDVGWSSDEQYFVRVEGEQGIAMLPLTSTFELQDLYLPDTVKEHIDHWISTSQQMYTRGDTVLIKGFVRSKSEGVRVVPKKGNFALCVAGYGGRQYEINEITLNQFGAYHASFQLSEHTEMGQYRLALVVDPVRSVVDPCSYLYNGRNYETPGVQVVIGGFFEVIEIETNPIQISLELNAIDFDRGDHMSISTRSEFYAGGPNSHGSGSIDISLLSGPPPFKTVDIKLYEFSGVDLIPKSQDDEVRIELDFELDEDGKFSMTIDRLNHDMYFGTYRIESFISDNQGKGVVAWTLADYYGVDQFVGIRHPVDHADTRYQDWSVRRLKVHEPWPVEVLVLSKDDEIVVGKDIQITVFSRGKELSFREHEWNPVFECELVSALDPVSCDFTPTDEGRYRIDAQIVDTKGYSHRSSVLIEAVTAKNFAAESVDPDNTLNLELLCDTNTVQVGALIRCTVENHLGNAPSLVTVEHDGVIDQWLARLDPANPIIEFKVLEEYAPSFSVSVLAQTPRSFTSSPIDTLFRIGTAEFTVNGPRVNQLEIMVSSERELYRHGDQVSLSLSTKHSKDSNVPIEYSVVVIDETIMNYVKERERLKKFYVLPIPHDVRFGDSATETLHFDPTKKSWHAIKNGVYTYGLIASLMEQSVAQQAITDSNEITIFGHGPRFNSKYLSVAWIPDDVGYPSLREVKKWVAYWNPSIITSDGQTNLDFELPNTHTRWKVMVSGVSIDDRFGFATTSFEAKKDIDVRAVKPNVVTEGDSFQVGASIRNRTKRKRTITVELNASGLLASESDSRLRRRVSLAPFETKNLMFALQADIVPSNISRTNDPTDILVFASVSDRKFRDELDMRIPVRRNRVRVSNVVYGTLDHEITTIPINFPNEPTNEDRQLDLTLTTSDTVNLSGMFRVVLDESYSSWEQKLSQAILAMQYSKLTGQDKRHEIQTLEADQLIEQTLDSAADFQALNGGMAPFDVWKSNESPYLSAFTALGFRWLEDAGYAVPQTVNRKLTEYLREYVKQENVNPQDYPLVNDENVLNQLRATNEAVMLHALVSAGELTETELLEYSNRIDQMDLFGLSHFLLATLKLDSTHPLNTKILERIMDRSYSVGGTLEFEESVPREFAAILHSKNRSNCLLLETLTTFSKSNSNSIPLGQLHELTNTVRFARKNLPNWSNMQENVFCTNALISFFEFNKPDSVNLLVTVDLRNDETEISKRLADAWQLNSGTTRLHAHHPIQHQSFGLKNTLEIKRVGNGEVFLDVELSYLMKVEERINRYSGLEVHREYVALRDRKWQILKPGDHINKGEYVLVNLYLNNRFDRHHVVIDDSVPGGLEPVNLNLGTEFRPPFNRFELMEILSSSELYKDFEKASTRRFPYRELGLQNVRFFAKAIRRGKYHQSWLGRAISSGEFTVLPTHVEEMYRPIMFGKSKPWTLNVRP